MADAPFGTSFGDPRKYMGQSSIGQAVKSGLLAYGMKKSGLTDWLDELSKKSKADVKIPGSVTPYTAISDQGQLAAVPQAPENMDWGTMAPVAPPSSSPVAPMGAAPAASPAAPETVQAPFTEPAPQAEPDIKPNDLGKDWLSGNVSSFVNPQAQRDIVPQMQEGYNQQLASGNDYQNVPGYGKLQKLAQAFFGA